MRAWRANAHIDFKFHDAHDLNTALDTSQPETIRRRLRERLTGTKQVVLLVGDRTRGVAARRSRFLYYEVETIRRLGLPVVVANLNGHRRAEPNRLPRILLPGYTISVSFQPRVIAYALDDWVGRYPRGVLRKSGPHQYSARIYDRLGLRPR
jgi:hypothetical protein